MMNNCAERKGRRTHTQKRSTLDELQCDIEWSDEFSTCLKLLPFLSIFHSSLVEYISGYAHCCVSVNFFFFLCHHKLLQMIFHRWQHVAAGIIINFHALRIVKRLFIMNFLSINSSNCVTPQTRTQCSIRWELIRLREQNNRKHNWN